MLKPQTVRVNIIRVFIADPIFYEYSLIYLFTIIISVIYEVMSMQIIIIKHIFFPKVRVMYHNSLVKHNKNLSNNLATNLYI